MIKVISVRKSYLTLTKKKVRGLQILKKRFRDLWQEDTGNPNINQVDIRKINNNKEDKSVLEIAKYSAKDSNLFHSKDTFEIFYKTLKGKRLLSYNGLFKDAMKEYKSVVTLLNLIISLSTISIPPFITLYGLISI